MYRLSAERIISDAAGGNSFIAEQICDVGKVSGGSSELFTSRKQIPEQLAQSHDDIFVLSHIITSRSSHSRILKSPEIALCAQRLPLLLHRSVDWLLSL